MTASVMPTSTVPFRNTVTSLSLSSSSSSSSSPRRHTQRTITLLLSLAIACCLLASSTSTLVAATPVPKVAHHQRQQRSLLQQVHHVQIADESVHNSMVLMKKSIQKRKQQQIKQQQQKQKRSQQQQQQQQQPSVHKKKLQKRVQSKEAPSTTAFAATIVDSLPADDLVNSRSGSETVKRPSGSKAHGISKGSERSKDSSSSSTTLSNKTTKNKKSQDRSKASRAKLISAYEAIVFSESQIPVFWSHDHHGRQQQIAIKKLQKQRPKPANLESKASEAMGSANKGQVPKKSKSPVAGDNVDSPLEIKAPVRGNGGVGEGQDHGQGAASHPESDKNRRATVEVVPVSVTANAQEQLGADEPREHLLPQQAKRATPAQDGSSQYHRRQYAPKGISAFLDNSCNSSSGMMISGALIALLLVSFKIYKRTQRQRQMAGLTPPQLDSPSFKAPISPSEL